MIAKTVEPSTSANAPAKLTKQHLDDLTSGNFARVEVDKNLVTVAVNPGPGGLYKLLVGYPNGNWSVVTIDTGVPPYGQPAAKPSDDEITRGFNEAIGYNRMPKLDIHDQPREVTVPAMKLGIPPHTRFSLKNYRGYQA